MACPFLGAKPLSEPMLGLLSFGPLETFISEIWIKMQQFVFLKINLKLLFT